MKKIVKIYQKSMVVLFLLAIVSGVSYAQTSLTQGYRTFLETGIMLDALTFPVDGNTLNPTNWAASNFTTVNTCVYPIPPGNGSSWGYWLREDLSNQVPATPGTPYADLLHVQYDDEQDISSGLSTLAATISDLKAYYPGQLVYTNQGIGSSGYNVSTFSFSTLMTYIQTVKPDMLNFTEYPFRWKDTGYVHDYEGGSPTTMYVHLEMYRKAGLAGLTGDGSQPIPVGMYVQQYAQLNSPVVNDREPSVSEMNLQTFAAWAFGFRKTTCFVYENGTANLDSVLFEGAGDDTPSAKFYQIAEMNRQSLNLGDALVRLISTDVRMKMGRREDGVTNPLPADTASEVAVGAWDSTADSYLKSVSATNNGTKNDGKEGDVIVGFFKPLDASLVEAGAENDVYFMIVNGLSDEAGTPAECEQTITLNFDFTGTDITQLLRLSRETGEVETVLLESDGGGLYHFYLTLNGGAGDLFKYDTGTEFVPEPATMSVVLLGAIGLVTRKTARQLSP